MSSPPKRKEAPTEPLKRAIGLCVLIHAGVTVGWPVFAFAAAPTGGGRPPGLASFSPFIGVVLPTAQMHVGQQTAADWNQVVGWVAFWTAADVAIAAALLAAVLRTFDRCLGRVAERSAPQRP